MKFFNNPYMAIVAMIIVLVVASISSFNLGRAMDIQNGKQEYTKGVVSGVRLENLRWLEMTQFGLKAPKSKELLDHEELLFPRGCWGKAQKKINKINK